MPLWLILSDFKHQCGIAVYLSRIALWGILDGLQCVQCESLIRIKIFNSCFTLKFKLKMGHYPIFVCKANPLEFNYVYKLPQSRDVVFCVYSFYTKTYTPCHSDKKEVFRILLQNTSKLLFFIGLFLSKYYLKYLLRRPSNALPWRASS